MKAPPPGEVAGVGSRRMKDCLDRAAGPRHLRYRNCVHRTTDMHSVLEGW